MTKDNNSKTPAYIAMESALGAILLLATKSPAHKYLFAGDFEWLIVPAIANKQFILYRNKQGEPVSFISWAKVSEDVENRLKSGILRLSPNEWNSGDNIYVIDTISPFIDMKNVLKQALNNQFKDKDVNILRPNKDQTAMESVKLNVFLNDLEPGKVDESLN